MIKTVSYTISKGVLAALVTILGITSGETHSDMKIGTNDSEMYPDFILPTLDGKTTRLSDYRGKKILLFHFASW